MKIAIYMNEFIYKYGGAEGYTANLIEVLQHIFKNTVITIITELYKKNDILSEIQFSERINKAYGVNINSEFIHILYVNSKKAEVLDRGAKIKVVSQFLKRQSISFFIQKKICKITKTYDLFISISPRYAFYGCAKKNIAVIHFPKDKLTSIPINKKLPWCAFFAKNQDKGFAFNTDLFIPNSEFTSYWLTQKWQIPEEKKAVIYPPVTKVNMQCEKKPKQIFVCSRIEATKKIDLLLKAFESSDFLKQNCTLVVAGSVKGESQEYIDSIQKISPSALFYFEPSRAELERLYAESEIFWHAKGIDEENPLYFEHFGITTVEAMSAGCIPIVINKGGQSEIVNESCGFKWNSLEELVLFTENLVKNQERMSEFRKNAVLRSQQYTKEAFEKSFKTILSEKLNISF